MGIIAACIAALGHTADVITIGAFVEKLVEGRGCAAVELLRKSFKPAVK